MDKKTKKLVEKLYDDDVKERYQAVLALGKTGDPELIPALDKVASLDDHPKIRKLAEMAVRALKKVEARQLEEARKAMRENEREEEWDLEWQLHGAKSDGDDSQQSENWTYDRAKESTLEAKAAEEAAQKAAIKEAAREKRRARRGFRLILWLSAGLGAIALTLVGDWHMERLKKQELRSWIEDSQAVVLNYQAAIENDELACETFFEPMREDEPATEFDEAELGPDSPTALFRENYDLEDLPDEANSDEWETVGDSMQTIRDEVEDIQRRIEGACSDDFNRDLSLIAGTLKGPIENALNAADAALTELD